MRGVSWSAREGPWRRTVKATCRCSQLEKQNIVTLRRLLVPSPHTDSLSVIRFPERKPLNRNTTASLHWKERGVIKIPTGCHEWWGRSKDAPQAASAPRLVASWIRPSQRGSWRSPTDWRCVCECLWMTCLAWAARGAGPRRAAARRRTSDAGTPWAVSGTSPSCPSWETGRSASVQALAPSCRLWTSWSPSAALKTSPSGTGLHVSATAPAIPRSAWTSLISRGRCAVPAPRTSVPRPRLNSHIVQRRCWTETSPRAKIWAFQPPLTHINSQVPRWSIHASISTCEKCWTCVTVYVLVCEMFTYLGVCQCNVCCVTNVREWACCTKNCLECVCL